MGRPTNVHLNFEETRPTTRKTAVVYVTSSRDNVLLGTISWFGRWRCYAFFPAPSTIFNHGCLVSINQYIAHLMDERK